MAPVTATLGVERFRRIEKVALRGRPAGGCPPLETVGEKAGVPEPLQESRRRGGSLVGRASEHDSAGFEQDAADGFSIGAAEVESTIAVRPLEPELNDRSVPGGT